jgi:RimJ/RimL family protein N-acetyltransferase
MSWDHIAGLVAAASEDRAAFEWTPVPDGEAETREYMRVALDLVARGAAAVFTTFAKADDRVVGSTRFMTFEHQPWPPGSPYLREGHLPDGVEIGSTWLAASAQRTAINTEAKFLMLRHAFETWGVQVVRLKTDRRNARSRAAIERLGARFDGVLRAHAVATDGQPRDSAYYSILASEWPEVRERLSARLERG